MRGGGERLVSEGLAKVDIVIVLCAIRSPFTFAEMFIAGPAVALSLLRDVLLQGRKPNQERRPRLSEHVLSQKVRGGLETVSAASSKGKESSGQEQTKGEEHKEPNTAEFQRAQVCV